jgi:hypothetical protein
MHYAVRFVELRSSPFWCEFPPPFYARSQARLIKWESCPPVRATCRANVIEMVWSAAADARWHSRRNILKDMPFRAAEVYAALDFLVRYGFAELSAPRNDHIRMIMNGPSPMEAMKLIRVLEQETGLHASCSCA